MKRDFELQRFEIMQWLKAISFPDFLILMFPVHLSLFESDWLPLAAMCLQTV